jgi:hypothetical protein
MFSYLYTKFLVQKAALGGETQQPAASVAAKAAQAAQSQPINPSVLNQSTTSSFHEFFYIQW